MLCICLAGAVSSNDAIIELLLLINSCKLASADSITVRKVLFIKTFIPSFTIQVVTPYFPYSKGDQKSSLRSPISSKLIANMLKR